MIAIIIAITILANLGDVLLKVGSSRAGESLSDPFAFLFIPWIWLGALLGLTAMALWVYVLGRHHLSHAYPVYVGLSFLNITLASSIYLGEEVGMNRVAGIALILVGILVVHFKSAGQPVAAISESVHDADSE